MGRLMDVSMDVYSGMTVWPGDDGVQLERVESIERGAIANISRLRCGVHTGTHVDAPLHFIADGIGIDRLPLDVLCGPAWTAGFAGGDKIAAEDLDRAGIPAGTSRLLLKTPNSRISPRVDAFLDTFAGLDESGAKWILRHGIRLVGNDYLSVACSDQTVPVHRLLLGDGVILVEGLRLQAVPAGPCRFYCLPLKLIGSDGAPARAMVEVD
jgi:arylformamidase